MLQRRKSRQDRCNWSDINTLNMDLDGAYYMKRFGEASLIDMQMGNRDKCTSPNQVGPEQMPTRTYSSGWLVNWHFLPMACCFVEMLEHVRLWFPVFPMCYHGYSTLESGHLHQERQAFLLDCATLSYATDLVLLKCSRPQALASFPHPESRAVSDVEGSERKWRSSLLISAG